MRLSEQKPSIEIEHFSFYYPEHGEDAGRFNADRGAGKFLVLCGPSGRGKSTLLRQLKIVLAPMAAGWVTSALRDGRWRSWISASRAQESALCSRAREPDCHRQV